ncbi:hypothetical protein D3C86_874820 [compost metagenome]
MVFLLYEKATIVVHSKFGFFIFKVVRLISIPLFSTSPRLVAIDVNPVKSGRR